MRFDVIYADPAWRFDNVKTGGSFTSGAEQVYTGNNNGRTTMALADIKALPVQSIAQPNAVLAIWTPTALKFSHGEPTAKAWGFRNYKTTWYWRKTRLGMGFWGRNMVEELLIFTCGDVAPFMLQEPNTRELPADGPNTVAQLRSRAQWYADGCPDLEDLASYQRDGLAADAADDINRALAIIELQQVDGEAWGISAPGEHSAKPDEFRAMLERATGHFSSRHQIELFGRKAVPGWTVLGDRIEGADALPDLCVQGDIRAGLLKVFQKPQP